MSHKFFQHKQLLSPPIHRAAYSDRTAWLMAEMARLAYLKFEVDEAPLKAELKKGGFVLAAVFDREGTQAFLAKREEDKMAVLAFRGTEKDDPRDIIADLSARFYRDEKGARIHHGFLKAYQAVGADIEKQTAPLSDYALYVTGHSLGGALAVMATRALNSDHIAACYTFGSPKVGCKEFDNAVKAPVYRVVNAFDIVPFAPPTYILELLSWLPYKKLQEFLKKFNGYAHHGDSRYLSVCGDDFAGLDVTANYNELLRLFGSWGQRKDMIRHHGIDAYCDKLAHWALKRNS